MFQHLLHSKPSYNADSIIHVKMNAKKLFAESRKFHYMLPIKHAVVAYENNTTVQEAYMRTFCITEKLFYSTYVTV
jgi:hypothetical protein